MLGDSSESESSTDNSIERPESPLPSSNESADDHDHDDQNIVLELSSTSSYDNHHEFYISDHDNSHPESVFSESLIDCYVSSSDTSSTNSDSSEAEEDINGSPADYAFMTESFHEGSSVTVGKAVLSVMQFCIDHHITYKATDELLKLLQVLCVTPNKLPRSVYLLKKFFQKFKRFKYSHNKVCSKCNKDNSNCSCDDPSHGDLIVVPIEKPLEAIVSSRYKGF